MVANYCLESRLLRLLRCFKDGLEARGGFGGVVELIMELKGDGEGYVHPERGVHDTHVELVWRSL